MGPAALLLAVPVALTVGGMVGARKSRLDAREDLGLRLPTARAAAVALATFLALSVITEVLYRRWGLDGDHGSWPDRYGTAELFGRVLLVALIYPIAEEFFFRGFVFGLLRRKAGETAAIGGSALFFTLLHLQYDWRGLSLVLADALFFGAVRSRSRSTILTMALHIGGNAFAVWQRL